MDTTVRARRRLDWAMIGTSLSLLALQGIVGSARAQMPSVVYPSGGGSEVVSHQSRNGMFLFDTAVNGTALPMIFDTGASYVALRAEDASKAGIDVGRRTYSGTVATANGQTKVALVMLSSLTVGSITRHNVQAVVHQPGALGANLLGQSFIGRLAGFKREGDSIILKGE